MLLALYDYVQYLFHKGKYSENRISTEGGKRATYERLASYKNCQAGDIFLYSTTNSFLSWLVMYYTGSVWSHVGTFVGDGVVVDATTSGVLKHPIIDYIDADSYILVRHSMGVTEEQRKKAIEFLNNAVGTSFNWRGVLRLFLRIILGKHDSYRIRYSVDFILLAIGTLFCLYSVPHAKPIILVLISSYILVVFHNCMKRRRMKLK
jgi:hypothetical protein